MRFSPAQPNSLTWPRPGGTAPCTGFGAGGGRRFLVLSATMGSGHEAVADVLSDRLTALGHHADGIARRESLGAGAGQTTS